MVQAAQDIAHARSPSPATHMRKPSRHSRSHSRSALQNESPIDAYEPTTPMVASPEVEAASHVASETTPLLADTGDNSSEESTIQTGHAGGVPGAGHSHGSMNMRALVLHVLGDALGNVGVIATGLVIWLTEWSFKFYFDPIISLVITVIIFSSALPLGEYSIYIVSVMSPDGGISCSQEHVFHSFARRSIDGFSGRCPRGYPRG